MTALRRLLRNLGATFGLFVVLTLIFLAVAAPVVAGYDPGKANLAAALQGPSAKHWLGTDELGRDLWSRMVYGSRISLRIAVVSVAIASFLGVALGAAVGFAGGWADKLTMRLIDALLSFPRILVAIIFVAVLGPGVSSLEWAIGLSTVPNFAQLARSAVLVEREKEYVLSARALGATESRVLIRHIIPNTVGPLLVQVTLNVAAAVLVASGLSFLGLGLQPPTPEWGAMVATGRSYLDSNPHMVVVPGMAIFATVLSVNLLGDGLAEALDPKRRR